MSHHASFLAGAIIFGITSFAFLVWVLFSKDWNRNIVVSSFILSWITLGTMLTGWYDLGIESQNNGATYSLPLLILTIFMGLTLSYMTGAFLYVDNEASLLAHFCVVLADGFLAFAATISRDNPRWAMFSIGFGFFVVGIITLASRRTRRDTPSNVVLVSSIIVGVLLKVLWILGAGADVIHFGTEILIWVLLLIIANFLIPAYMSWYQLPAVHKTDANGKETFFIWSLFGKQIVAFESTAPSKVQLTGARRGGNKNFFAGKK